MPRATLGGHTIHYQQVGHGPNVVLIHGLFCNIAFWWFRVAPKLAEKHRVTALDLRGHGFSGMSEAGYRAVDLGDDVAALMDHLGIRKAHIVGHSFGGAVALALAAKHPEKVEKVTLADAWVPSMQEMPPLNDDNAWPGLQKRLRARGINIEGELPKVAQGFFEELLDTPHGPGGGIGTAGALAMMPVGGGPKRRPSRALRRWRELMERTSAHKELHDPTGLGTDVLRGVERPVDLVYGERSRYLASRDQLARVLPGQRVVTVPEVGHYFPLLRPDSLLRALEGEQTTPLAGGDERK